MPMPLCQPDRLHPGGLADHRVAAKPAVRIQQRLGAAHAALLVGGRDQDQGMLQTSQIDVADRLERHREEALHVAGPQAIPAPVALGQPKGIRLPACLVVRHRVGMARQYQAIRTAAGAGHQVELAGVARDRQTLDSKASGLAPVCKMIDHPDIGLVPFRAHAADRRRADQALHHFLELRVFHGSSLDHAVTAVQSGWVTIRPWFFLIGTIPRSTPLPRISVAHSGHGNSCAEIAITGRSGLHSTKSGRRWRRPMGVPGP